VSDPANEISNNIFTGSLVNDIAWNMNMDSISEQTGRFLFTEGINERLYAVSYFTGDQIFVRSITGTSALPDIEYKQNSIWQIFPNPFLENFTISSNIILEAATVKIYNISGKEIYCENFSNVLNFKIGAGVKIPPGIYLVSVTAGNETWTQKIIKE